MKCGGGALGSFAADANSREETPSGPSDFQAAAGRQLEAAFTDGPSGLPT
jgi:hypothetical protein